MGRLDAIRAVHEAVDRDTSLNNREKRRIKASVRWRPRVRAEVAGLVLAECHAEQLITEDGRIEAAADWESILQKIQELLPAILQLISMF